MVAISPHVDDELTNELFRVPMLEDFSFDDLFLDFSKDVLPDLEVDLDDFSFDDDEHGVQQIISPEFEERSTEEMKSLSHDLEDRERASSRTSKEDSKVGNAPSPDQATKERSKSSLVKASSKGSQGKRKVDWTPELHRRFVQAVEYLGIDKAVPSRILEIMGIDCLTRHNVASHLQKYRSHRKHLLAREAEAVSLSHRRQMSTYATAPSMGFPPPPAPPPPPHAFRPLHVWGHPTRDHMWPANFISGAHAPSPSTPPLWIPPVPHTTPPPWLPHFPCGPNAVTQSAPCFPRPVPPPMRFPPPAVPCVPPHSLYKPNKTVTTEVHPNSKKLDSQILDAASKERVDAAIGDVLAKPRLPLPLGLKPPSLDGVLVELQKQGISKVPPPK